MADSNPHCVEFDSAALFPPELIFVSGEECVMGGDSTVVTNSYTETQVLGEFDSSQDNHNVAIVQDDGVKVNGWTTTETADTTFHENYHYPTDPGLLL